MTREIRSNDAGGAIQVIGDDRPVSFGDVFAPQAPRVASVDRSFVRPGSTFTITSRS